VRGARTSRRRLDEAHPPVGLEVATRAAAGGGAHRAPSPALPPTLPPPPATDPLPRTFASDVRGAAAAGTRPALHFWIAAEASPAGDAFHSRLLSSS